MKKVERNEILDYVTYEEQRAEIRASALRAKDARRIHLGENLTFLFENHETIRYQILEMIRTERMVKEADIQHEIDTYNELIGENGRLGCTLLVEIADADERAEKLTAWTGLPEKFYLEFTDGTKAYAQIDERQNEEGKISSVQFIKFDCGGKAPVAIGSDFEGLHIRSELSGYQKNTLAKDVNN